MRVISGKYRRLTLETLEGNDVRPTNDRIKETLFNMISDDVYGCKFLDLFAGSGQIGIEALSRGAEHVTFVEKNPKAYRCIQNNLSKIKADDNYTLILSDVFRWLEQGEEYDIIFTDPPYAIDGQEKLIQLIDKNNLLTDNGIIVLEADKDNETDFETAGIELFKIKEYKTNKHIFLRKRI